MTVELRDENYCDWLILYIRGKLIENIHFYLIKLLLVWILIIFFDEFNVYMTMLILWNVNLVWIPTMSLFFFFFEIVLIILNKWEPSW
jgi:hypothetical protein